MEPNVGRDKRSNFGKSASANGFAQNSEPATLSIGQAESPATKLLPQDTILLAEVIDDRTLLAANPAGHGGNEDLPRL